MHIVSRGTFLRNDESQMKNTFERMKKKGERDRERKKGQPNVLLLCSVATKFAAVEGETKTK